MGINQQLPTANLHIRSTTPANSGQYALKIEDNSGNNLFSVRDDRSIELGSITIGNFQNGLFFQGTNGMLGLNMYNPTANLHIRSTSPGNIGQYALKIEDNSGNNLFSVRDDRSIELGSITIGNFQNGLFFQGTNGMLGLNMYNPTANLHIRSTSPGNIGQYALKIEDNSGNNLFSVQDDGTVMTRNLNIGQQLTIDTIHVNTVIASRITTLPGDSLIHFGDSSLIYSTMENRISWTPYTIYPGGPTPPMPVEGFSLGNNYPIAYAQNSIAIGTSVTVGASGDNSIVMGKDIQNDIPNSFMIGFNNPTLFVGSLHNVGIGTSSPNSNYKLHIKGNTFIDQGNLIINSSSAQYPMQISTGGANTFLDITNTNQDAAGLRLMGGGTGSVGVIMHATGPGNYQGANKLVFHATDSIDLFCLNLAGANQGNVGIGTTTPSRKLEIAHNDAHGGITLNRLSTTTAKSQFSFQQYGVEKWAMGNDMNQDNSQNFFIWDNVAGASRFFIDGSGNVGIGTTSSSAFVGFDGVTIYKLAVNGNIRAKRVVVETNWSDFVFNDNYKLKSLADLEKYIQANKHLPEIPSAKEVEENGADIGMMQSKLLQKVEELTLYLIEQNKKIAELEKKINEQSKINR